MNWKKVKEEKLNVTVFQYAVDQRQKALGWLMVKIAVIIFILEEIVTKASVDRYLQMWK